MIRCIYRTGEQQFLEGGNELVARWQEDEGSRIWIDIEGEVGGDVIDLLRAMGCDPLAITDSSRLRHPPKIEHFENNTFMLFRGIAEFDESLELLPQQLGIWVAERHIITVHRGHSVSVDGLWQRALKQERLTDPGRLALRLIHYASGRYLNTLLEFEERLSRFEDNVLADISESDMKELVAYRSRLRKLRRIFSYHHTLADAIYNHGGPYLGEGEGEGEDALHHIRRDVFDRCERLYSLCSMYYELCSDLVEGHISLTSHRLNETMKILTIISAVFVPMTFMAGIYGMNFEHMPELSWRYAYFVLLGIMALMAIGMMLIFKRFKWL